MTLHVIVQCRRQNEKEQPAAKCKRNIVCMFNVLDQGKEVFTLDRVLMMLMEEWGEEKEK